MSNTSFEMYPLSSISTNIINNAFNIELLRPTTCSNQTGQVRNTKVRATNHLSLTLSSFFLARQHSKIVNCSLSLCFSPSCEFLSISPEILLLFFNFLLNFLFFFLFLELSDCCYDWNEEFNFSDCLDCFGFGWCSDFWVGYTAVFFTIAAHHLHFVSGGGWVAVLPKRDCGDLGS